jgi:hypothetical protein
MDLPVARFHILSFLSLPEVTANLLDGSIANPFMAPLGVAALLTLVMRGPFTL